MQKGNPGNREEPSGDVKIRESALKSCRRNGEVKNVLERGLEPEL